MTNVNSSNAPYSDTVLPTVPPKTRHYDTNDDSVFLAQQAADAKAAMQRTVAEMQTTAQQAANVRWWTQQYPWYAVGAAAVLGFVAATQIGAGSPAGPPPAAASGQTAARQSWMAPLFEMLRTTLMSTIIGAVHASGQQTGQAEALADGGAVPPRGQQLGHETAYTARH
jgi:hypothetical protein